LVQRKSRFDGADRLGHTLWRESRICPIIRRCGGIHSHLTRTPHSGSSARESCWSPATSTFAVRSSVRGLFRTPTQRA
jgi:hypothetical protein